MPKYTRITNLLKVEEEYMLGSLLGDASIGIQPKGVTPRLQMRHSITQRHWFYAKARVWHRFASPKAIHLQKPDGYSKRCKLHFQSLSQPALLSVYKRTHKNGLTRAWLKKITPRALMVWWLDDGSLIGKGRRKGRWNTQGFHKRGTTFLVEFLAKKYQIKSVVASYVYKKNKKRYYYIYIQPLPLKRLLLLMLPFVTCKQMLYKFFLVYKNAAMQEHWITTMKTTLPQFSNEIDRLSLKYCGTLGCSK